MDVSGRSASRTGRFISGGSPESLWIGGWVGRLERELKMVQLSATKYTYIAIL